MISLPKTEGSASVKTSINLNVHQGKCNTNVKKTLNYINKISFGEHDLFRIYDLKYKSYFIHNIYISKLFKSMSQSRRMAELVIIVLLVIINKARLHVTITCD